MKRRSLTLITLAFAAGCGSGATKPTTPGSPAEPEVGRVVETQGVFRGVMAPAVTSFGAATDGRHVYVLGGYHGTPHAYSREGQSRTLSRMPIEGGAFEVVAELPHGVQGLAMVHVAGKLCTIGGNVAENEEGEPSEMRSSDEAWCYDPEAAGWSRLPALPAGRSSHEAAAMGTTIYVAGGWELEGEATTGRFHETLLALDLADATPEWREIRAPFERRAVGVAALGDRLAIVGGITSEGDLSRRVDLFDPRTGEFTRGPDYPEDAFGVAVTHVGDAVVASAADGAVHRLGTEGERWERLGALAFGRFFHQLVPSGDDAVLALGGISGMHTFGRTRPVERFELARSAASLGVITVEVPFEAKNRQGIFLAGDHLYLFGGNRSLGQHDFEPRHFSDEGVRVHLPSLSFERVASFPEKRQTMSTLVVSDKGLALGGFGHDGVAAVSHVDGFLFDFERGRFSDGPSLPSSRTQFGLAEHEGALYVFGGLDYDPARGEAAFDHVRTTLRAATTEGPFEEIDASLPGPRRAFAGAALDGRYYLVGGMKENFQLVDDCLAFDFEEERFDPIACPGARLSGDLVPLGGRLYLVGGGHVEGEQIVSARSIEEYDPARDTWRTVVDELPFETSHMRALAYGERLLLISTHFEEPRLRIALVDVSGARDARER